MLTDISTGWTECLPLINRSPETVLAAFQRARVLFSFPKSILHIQGTGSRGRSLRLTPRVQQALTVYLER